MKAILSEQGNKILVYLLTVLIPLQVFFPFYRGKYITVFMALTLLLFIDRNGLTEARQLWKDKILFYALFWLMLLTGFFYSGDKWDAFKHIFILGLGLPIYFIYKNVLGQRKIILKIFLWASLPLALFIILLFIKDAQKLQILSASWLRIFIDPKALQSLIDGTTYYNVLSTNKEGGFFLNANDASIYMCFAIAVAGWLALTEKKPAVYLAAGAIFILGLIFTGSYSGIYSFFIAVTVVTTLYFSRRSRVYKVILILALAIMFSFGGIKAFTALNPRYNNDQFKFLGDNMVMHNRLPIWRASVEVIKQHPWFGIGLDKDNWNASYNIFAPRYQAPLNTPPHNMYLFFWAKSGIFTLLLLVWFLFSNIRYLLVKFYRDNEIYCLAMFFCFIPLVLVGMTEAIPLMEIRILSAFFMLLGLAI